MDLLSQLKIFSHGLGPSYPYDDTARYYKDCWKEIPNWIEAAERDFLSRFEHIGIVKSVQLILNEPTFKQSASGIIFYFGVVEDFDIKIRLECLIDHSKAEITVLKRPQMANPKLEMLADLVERKGWTIENP